MVNHNLNKSIMKKIYSLFVLSLITISSVCQIFEHQFDEDFGRIYQVSGTEYVYGILDNAQKKVFIYSLDYNLIKTIDLFPDSAFNFSILNVSKTLFNADNKFEICYCWWASNYGLKVINEDGNILLSEDGSLGADFYNTNIGAKMIISFNYVNKLKVYSLYGTVLSSGINITNKTNMNLFPNPASNEIIIDLTSPISQQDLILSIYSSDYKLIKNIKVLPDQKVISIDIAELRPGIYFYNIHNNIYSTSINKFIVKR
jgi:hypothetical protein